MPLTPKQAGYNTVQVPTMSPQVRALWEQLQGQSQPGVSKGLDFLTKIAGGDPSQFEQMEAPAHRQFQGMIGNISSRFSGQGDLGARRSSGFQHEATSASQSLAEKLQADRMGFQKGAIDQLLNIYQNLMGNDPYQMQLQQKKKPSWYGYLSGGLPIAGATIGGIAGGPAGAVAGATIGSAAGNAFS